MCYFPEHPRFNRSNDFANHFEKDSGEHPSYCPEKQFVQADRMTEREENVVRYMAVYVASKVQRSTPYILS